MATSELVLIFYVINWFIAASLMEGFINSLNLKFTCSPFQHSDECKTRLSVVQICPHLLLWEEVGPMNYSLCGSHFGQWGLPKRHTEFDKAAKEQKKNESVTFRALFIMLCLNVRRQTYFMTIFDIRVHSENFPLTFAHVSSGTVALAPNRTAMSRVYTVNFSRAWSTAGPRWEFWPEPGRPSSSSLGRYDVGWLSTLLHGRTGCNGE